MHNVVRLHVSGGRAYSVAWVAHIGDFTIGGPDSQNEFGFVFGYSSGTGAVGRYYGHFTAEL